jgi:hypothetical protein
VTIPHLIASAASVSTFEAYASTFNRVLDAVGASGALTKLLDEEIDADSIGGIVSELYKRRSILVHEIRIQTIGHRNIRDFSSFEDISKQGRAVMRLIKGTELAITQSAPSEFPNLLDEEGNEMDEVNRLKRTIARWRKRYVGPSGRTDVSKGSLSASGSSWLQDGIATSKRSLHLLRVRSSRVSSTTTSGLMCKGHF